MSTATTKRRGAAAVIQVRHGLSEEQASDLRELIGKHVNAQVADSWKGGGDPLDAQVIEADAAAATARLESFISKLVREVP